MRVIILSRNPRLYSTQRIVEAAKKQGCDVRVIDYLRCYMNITSSKPTVLYAGKELTDVDVIIPRIGASHTFYGTAVVRQFETMKIPTLNRSQAITRSRDKLRSMQILSQKGIGLPVTGCAHSTKDIEGLIKIAGGTPLVVKLLEGTQGIGVVLAETKKAAESVIEAFRGLDANILVQEFIKEASGADVRCFVVGGQVVASMLRKAKEGEFRSNLHRGGKGTEVEITEEERTTALRACAAMGLGVAGVDILRSNRGPLVLEVNSTPGLKGIEEATGKNVADMIIRHVIKKANSAALLKDRE